eukprot:gene863-1684_t
MLINRNNCCTHFAIFTISPINSIAFLVFWAQFQEIHMLSKIMRNQLRSESAVLFLCDIQERFRPILYRSETIIHKSALLHKVSNILDIPTIVTEQYPKAFGRTILDLNIKEGTLLFEKKKFSMMIPEVESTLQSLARNQIILCGGEAHVCVLQTALDLLSKGMEVHIICDAVTSQRSHDRSVALQRLSSSGAVLTTAESAIFQLLNTADHPHFRTISGLVKDHNLLPNEFASDSTH